MTKILIKNGTVIDGLSKHAYKSDVVVDKGRILEIAASINGKNFDTVIDAAGQFVTPGFIDIQNHSDSYWTLFDQPDQRSLISQGITTIVVGNCGSSVAPLPTKEAIKTIQKWHNLDGINVNWTSFAEFCSVLKQSKLGVNVAGLVGHATLRRGLLGDQVRKVTPDEQKIMTNLLREALDQGAMGLSLGLVYAHEVNSTMEELSGLAKHLKSQNKYLSVHLRSEDTGLLESIDEVLEIGEQCDIPVKISHLKVRGQTNWHLFDRMMNKLENAFHQGLNVSFDVYPYSTSWSILYTYLPKWAYEGGRSEILRRINSPEDRRKILDYLRNQNHDYLNITIATAEGNEALVGRLISHVAVNQGVTNEEALLNILSACNTQAIVFDRNLSEEHIELLLTSPLSIIASDGAGYSKESPDLVHPRCFGTMPRFLSMVKKMNILKWEQAIKKITYEPARLLGLQNRGVLTQNANADIVVFDPNKIVDMADYTQPYQFADGITHVLVNGEIAYSNKSFKDLNGQVITR
ncbi:MAG TPA: D-aminoacylase [Verrucomicrobiae bacterium]|nr:D-aminoacylase [Verrucomicrobiae bacterium]